MGINLDANARLSLVWDGSVEFGAALLERLEAATRESSGVFRQPYGVGEQRAHELVSAAAAEIGLDLEVDAAGNLLMTLQGLDPARSRWLTGSHLDSVPGGGNFDGAAGVVAGLVVAHALRQAELVPTSGLTIIATRAEEGSSWFKGGHESHFGSRAALGQLSRVELERATTLDDGRSLNRVIADSGFSPEEIELGQPLLDESAFRAFVELHIEQGPVLVHENLPVGIVTGIRGNLRLRDARVIGEEAHSGAVPQEYRHDALLAATEMAVWLEKRWNLWIEAGRDAVCTFGRFGTDPERHSMTKVPGEVRFSLDIRSEEKALLDEAKEVIMAEAALIGERRGVDIALGGVDCSSPAHMAPELVGMLGQLAKELGIPSRRLPSGGGHDAVNFAAAGWPTAMIFVRNPNGSHNPKEAMAIDDFSLAARLLAALVLKE